MTGGILYQLNDGYFAGVGTEGAGRQVVLTGYKATSRRGSVGYQTTGGYFIILSEGWEHVGTVNVLGKSDNAAQKLVDSIINDNAHILCNNLLCARFASKLTADQQQQVRNLQSRLETRNQALQDDGMIQKSSLVSNYPKGYGELEGYLQALMAGNAIGVVSWAFIIVSAVIIAGMGTAAYYTYKYFADEAAKDVQYSDELTRVLTSKLTPEEYQQLLDETNGFVTKHKIAQALSGWKKNIIWIVGGLLAGAAALTMIKNRL